MIDTKINSPKLSVIVAIYKVENYLQKCVESILGQEFADFELILVDDGSPDNCGEICDKYAQKDSRIVVIHKENGGLSDARNVGLEAAKGDYVGFVDSDDYICSNMYQRLIEVAEETAADLVICDNYRVYEDNGKIEVQNWLGESKEYNNYDIMREILYDNIGSQAWNKLYKNDLFKDVRYPVGRTYCQDLATTYYYFEKCHKVKYIAEPLYFYLVRNTSASFNYKDPNKKFHIFLGFTERYEFSVVKYPCFSHVCLKLAIECGVGCFYNAFKINDENICKSVADFFKTNIKKIGKSKKLTVTKKIYAFLILSSPRFYVIIQSLANKMRYSKVEL
ncbi:putative glycosyltransferase EpsJ [Sedimentisphaera cyanobacteriorum]|uniref:Putative glycosyltransferase EpsJ n=1 Tax=Sedimentisphaera cyanobacteriorum TaxID=1940790 RepID=A0A1Q2HPJ1_9BACT|nr:glycosyltransferase [Sedimentisphaera cyanobacteriorum]AQQ09166.1 putative glycosyltransferase EpsJ [Sedimentisphaera cyanobacteriorum]